MPQSLGDWAKFVSARLPNDSDLGGEHVSLLIDCLVGIDSKYPELVFAIGL